MKERTLLVSVTDGERTLALRIPLPLDDKQRQAILDAIEDVIRPDQPSPPGGAGAVGEEE